MIKDIASPATEPEQGTDDRNLPGRDNYVEFMNMLGRGLKHCLVGRNHNYLDLFGGALDHYLTVKRKTLLQC
jgi:hypothetical protein